MFFVLNAGRSGSRTLATVLSQSPTCTCLHEPYPQLIAESVRYRYGEITSDALVDILRETRGLPDRHQTYGECANRLSLLVPVLRQAFPDARFVHLVRDGRDFVSSAVQRGWYGTAENDPATQRSEWQQWRLSGDRAGAVDSHHWAAMGQFERVCWLWTYTHEILMEDLEGCPSMLLRIEELARSLPDLCAHLSIAPTNFQIVRANRRRTADDAEGSDRRKTNMVDELFTWHDWDDEQAAIFAARCGPIMDRLYPSWHEWTEPEARDPDSGSARGRPAPAYPIRETDGDARLARMESALDEVRRELAEIALLRQEHRTLLAEYQRSQTRTEEARHLQAEADRARDKAVRVSAETARGIRAAEAQITAYQARLSAAEETIGEQHERLRLRTRQLQKLRESRPYRVGKTLAKVALAPKRIGLRTARGALTALPPEQQIRIRELVGRARARPPAEAPHLIPPVMAMPAPDGTEPPLPVLVLSLGADEARLDALLQELDATAAPAVVVTDCDAFHLFRRRPLPFEYLPPRTDWERHGDGESYDAFVEGRLRSIAAIYRPAGIVVAEGHGDTRSLTASMVIAVSEGT